MTRRSRTRGSAGSTRSSRGGWRRARRRCSSTWATEAALIAPAGEGLGERRVQRGGADLIEQAQQARGLAGEGVAADGEGVEEGLGLGAGVPEAIAAAEVVGVALLGDERGEMGVVFDALPAIVAARVAGDLGGAVEQAHAGARTATRVSGRRTSVCGIE